MSATPRPLSAGEGPGGESTGPAVPASVWLRGPDAVAGFTPEEGMYCTAFRVRTAAGWWPVLAEPPDWERLRARPAFYGNPVLFPFPMAVSDGRFPYAGREVRLPPSREGRVIHGFVRDAPWTVERRWTDAAGDHLQAALTTAGDPALLASFPFAFRLRVVYSLLGTTLTLGTEATNLGDGPMPAALGVHPYFPLPPRPDGRTEDLVVRSDVTHTAVVAPGGAGVELLPAADPVDLLAGRRVAPWLTARMERTGHGAGAAPVYARVDARSGAVFPAPPAGAGTAAGSAGPLDDDGVAWSLTDTRLRREVTVRTSDAYRVLVLFAPRQEATVLSPVLCTCLPDAFNLAAHGHAGGMVEIAPGASWRTRVRLTGQPGQPATQV